MASYRGKDAQSDAEACHVLNPFYISKERWDDMGLHLWQLKLGLSCGSWTGCSGFRPIELLENAATGF